MKLEISHKFLQKLYLFTKKIIGRIEKIKHESIKQTNQSTKTTFIYNLHVIYNNKKHNQ